MKVFGIDVPLDAIFTILGWVGGFLVGVAWSRDRNREGKFYLDEQPKR